MKQISTYLITMFLLILSCTKDDDTNLDTSPTAIVPLLPKKMIHIDHGFSNLTTEINFEYSNNKIISMSSVDYNYIFKISIRTYWGLN